VPDKIEIALIDNTWLEGIKTNTAIEGIFLTDVHRSRTGEAFIMPIGKSVFVPWSAILFIIQKK